jgi:hypothetical protein
VLCHVELMCAKSVESESAHQRVVTKRECPAKEHMKGFMSFERQHRAFHVSGIP